MAPQRWPSWWKWDVELSTHVERRMVRRDFSEVDLRSMFERTERVRRDYVEGRYVVVARFRRRIWHIIVEPNHDRMCIVVVTAYPIES